MTAPRPAPARFPAGASPLRGAWQVARRVAPGLAAAVRRVPLTLAMVATAGGVALATGAVNGRTAPAVIARWGFSLDNLARGRLLTLVTGDWLVFDRRHLFSVLVMLAAGVGPLEALAGRRLAALAFWSATLTGSFATAILTAAGRRTIGWQPTPDLVATADVGASVGCWGAAGALILVLARRGGRWAPAGGLALAGGAAFLLGRLATARGAADLAHALGFAVGAAVAAVAAPRPPLAERV